MTADRVWRDGRLQVGGHTLGPDELRDWAGEDVSQGSPSDPEPEDDGGPPWL